ncbi:ABC transporter permease [Flexilinea flocculi]|jgi:ABC-type dipeptide/oligopeptide/nickel transport system permease component|uniref:ABC-type dipeptide/oligopeptide/nickel transport system, permease component n=1 Tax=Flexilinea flocculi TaxID=1678840 RepID=A0A0K8P9H7_9CHLR|nr:ABC transporter permease [Flexilinea flocculi]NMB94652.1 ABC transporter permease [Flexilinea flocculi]GAP39286.1 ABC-type dipeptide/oligopeptide/nickel transport system, permease component [Flexilinea flocculi]
MGRYIIRRLLYMFLVILVVSVITFGLMHSVPGGPFDKEKPLPKEIIANLEKRYHLDQPLPVQYLQYLKDLAIPRISTTKFPNSIDADALFKFKIGKYYVRWVNFGPSYSSRSRTVNDMLRDQLPISIQLGFLAFCVAVVIGMPLGILAALKQNSWVDYTSMTMAIFGVSVPVIVLGPILVWIFGVSLKVLPVTGWGSKPPFAFGIFSTTHGWKYWQYAIMPMFALGLSSSASIARLTRASLLQVIREDYIRTAREKGLRERNIVIKHALKNSLIPVITIMGPMFAGLLTGTFVTETIFGIPGMGRYFVNSITNRDYPVIMGTVLIYAIFLVLCNLIVDLVYGFLDPRIRFE